MTLAPFVQIEGRGQGRAKPLTLAEAQEAMPNARVVFSIGDICVLADNYAPDFKYRTGPMANARSKLGHLWQMAEMTRGFPDLHPIAVHPGVISSGFAGSKSRAAGWFKDRIVVTEEAGGAVDADRCNAAA